MSCQDFEVSQGEFFLIALQTPAQPGPKGAPLSRTPTPGTTKRSARGISITTKRKSVASSHKQRKTTPSPVDM